MSPRKRTERRLCSRSTNRDGRFSSLDAVVRFPQSSVFNVQSNASRQVMHVSLKDLASAPSSSLEAITQYTSFGKTICSMFGGATCVESLKTRQLCDTVCENH